MLTFMMIPDTEKFLEVASKSRGDIFLHLPDGSLCDLKHSHVAQQVLKAMEPGREGLKLSLSSGEDVPAFLRYMQEAALDRTA